MKKTMPRRRGVLPIRYDVSVRHAPLVDTQQAVDRFQRTAPRLWDTVSVPSGVMRIAEVYWHTLQHAHVLLDLAPLGEQYGKTTTPYSNTR